MDINEILKTISDIPFYIWLILFVIVGFVFKDKSRWEKEVKFYHTDGVGRGEVEIEHSKRKGTEIEVEMKLVEKLQHKPVYIFVNGQLACTVPPQLNDGRGRDFKARYTLGKPKPGDEIQVVVENQTIFESAF